MENIELLIKELKEKNLKLITAESCTGGLIGKSITDVSGASEVYDGGLITYSNEMKMMLLKVKEETLKNFGAVSNETAMEMAKGAIDGYNADIAVSVTGVAGPGCSEKKPAGLVYIGIATKDKIYAKEYHFKGNREEVRAETARTAINMVIKEIKDR